MRSVALVLIILAFSACIAGERTAEEPPKPEEMATQPTTTPPVPPPQNEEGSPQPSHESTQKINLSLLWSFSTKEPVYGVAVGRRYIAVASYENKIYLLNMSGAPVWSFKTRGNAEAVALSEGENYLLATSYLVPEARVYLFRLAGGNISLIWEKTLQSIVKGVAISEEANLVIVAAGNGRAYAYTLEGEPRWTFEIQESAWGVWDVALQGGRVALAGDDTYLYLLDTDGRLLWRRGGKKGSHLYGCALSPELVAGAAQDRVLYVYSLEGKLLWKFKTGFSNHDVAIAENPELIALSSWDKKVYILSYSGEVMAELEFEQEPTEVDFAPDGQSLAVGSRDGKVYLFGIEN
jgi:outer membrane protein assembly factor BamB